MTMPGATTNSPDPVGLPGRVAPAPDGAPQPSLEALARQWQAASDQVFTSALSDPAAYIRATRLVGAVVADLRTRGHGREALLEAWREHREVIVQVASDDDLLTTEGLDLTAVAGAAFAMRHREVAHDMANDARREALSRLTPAAWAVLEESGYAPGDPFVPYRRLEVHPGTGRALLVTTSPDECYRTCTHRARGCGA